MIKSTGELSNSLASQGNRTSTSGLLRGTRRFDKVLYCAYTGCMGSPNPAPCSLSMGFLYMKILICNVQKKHARAGCTGAKICAPSSQNVHTWCRGHP